MKTLYDYVKEHGTTTTEIITPPDAPNVTITMKPWGERLLIYDANGVCIAHVADELEEFLYNNFNAEIRFCSHCGGIMQSGYTAEGGGWYCHEECFPEEMDELYGEGNWRKQESDEENEAGGYYEYRDENGNWNAEPSYYTEWY